MESYYSLISLEGGQRQGSEKPKACRDRVNQTADAEAMRGMGVLCPRFFSGRKKTERTDGTDAE